MTKALAVRPKGKHPLHVLRELEVWPAGPAVPGGGVLRERVLAGLPRMQRAQEAWSVAGLRSDKVLQEIFHTEEKIAPSDVPRLCCGLPGIEGCVLARRREVLSVWNMPLDLEQAALLEAASGAMDRAMDARSAGWGEPRGITLHLEVGNASLLRCDAMQLLVLHEKRGFAPGVREKLTMALGAVARSLKAAP
ncbi:MAG: hypothetical protein FGM15_09045 [Chthoniobacterales bacterium]|nr:hypothetical protein [Chthoniobacterales bacterium]